MNFPWYSGTEIDDLCAGARTNACRVRRLQRMGLTVNVKPNGRPLVMRAHGEIVLSGLSSIAAAEPASGSVRPLPTPNRAGLLLLFKKSKAT